MRTSFITVNDSRKSPYSDGPTCVLVHMPRLEQALAESREAGTDLAHSGGTRFSVVRPGPHAEPERTERADYRARTRCPPAPERDRTSVVGPYELSGTGAQSRRSADISCEHPVGGPCVSGPMKVRHADQWSTGENRWGSSDGPNQLMPHPLNLQTWAIRPVARQ